MQKGQNIYFFPGWKFSDSNFQPEVKGTCISKRSHPGVKFYSGVNFTLPTCNMPDKKGTTKATPTIEKNMYIIYLQRIFTLPIIQCK